MILLRSFLSGHIRIKRTLEYYDAGIGPRVPFGGGFGPTVSANFAVALGDFTTLSSTSTMPTGGSISRAGNAMLYAVDGGVAKLTYAPNNLLLNSATLSTQSVTTAAINYILSFSGTGSVALSGAYTGNLAGTGVSNRVYLAFTSTAASLTLTVTGSVTSAQLEAVTYQTTPSTYVATTTSAYYGPRFDYDPVTLQPKGLLVEGTRTNVVLYSSDYTVGNWTKSGIAFGTPVLAPDGTTTATTISATSANADLYQSTGGTAGTKTHTWYVRRKTGTGTLQWVTLDGGRTNVTQTISSSVWTRIEYTETSSLTNNYTGLRIVTSGDEFYIWGAQLEAGSFATSYIPTVANATARAAETFSLTGYANRLVEAYYIDEQTGANYSGNSALSTGTVTISPPTFGWVTSLRAYQNAYAGSISSPSWLSFSGTTGTTAGNRTYYDSTGTLTWAPANLLAYSQDYRDTTAAGSTRPWIWDTVGGATPVVTINAGTAPDGTLTANRVILNKGAGTYSRIRQDAAAINGPVYLFSVYMKTYSGGTSNVGLRLDGTGVNCVVTGTWQRFSLYVASSSASASAQILLFSSIPGNDNTADLLVWGAQVEPVTYQTAPSAYIPTTSAAVYGPRYDYDPSTVPATPRGLLIEESRANLLTYSEQFENAAYTTSALNISGSPAWINVATAPNGTNTADKITEDTTNSQHNIQQTYSSWTSGVTYTASVYVKAAGRNILGIVFPFSAYGAWKYASFNLTTGTTITVDSGVTATIVNVGNGWYRCSAACAATANASGAIAFKIQTVGTSQSESYAGDGVSGLFIWGAQLEAASFATSYIPSITGATRAPDVAAWTSAAFSSYWNASAGTIAAEATINGRNSSASPVFGLTGIISATNVGATSNYDIRSDASGITYLRGTPLDPVIVAGTNTIGAVFRVLAAYKSADYAASFNGGNAVTAATVGVNTPTTLQLGLTASGTGYLNGYLRSFAYYNQRLPNAILKQKSQVNAPY